MKVLELGKTSLCLGPFKDFWAVVCESLVNFTQWHHHTHLTTQCRHHAHITRKDRLTGSLEDVDIPLECHRVLTPLSLQNLLMKL